MSDAKEILEMILNDEKLLKSRAFRDKVYKDEPIIRTASQLIKPATPSKIKEMKGIAFTPEAYWKTSAWLFYTQGKFMEDYEDDFTYTEDLVKYYPCYRDLSTEQLRGYFSWRTKVRKNIIEKAPLPFVYIYIYELVNCIGYDSPLDCYNTLKEFLDKYSMIDASIKKYTDTWLLDFIVYYDLDPALANELEDIKYDYFLLTLIHWEEKEPSEIFNAISELSSYQIKKSLIYISNSKDIEAIIVRCFISLSRFFKEKRKNSLFYKMFGNMVECSYHMFSSAIFYDRNSLRNCEYTINEIHSYTCKSGKWQCKKYYGNRGRNGHLGDLIKAIDSLVREHIDFKHKISFSGISKSSVKLIIAEIEKYYAEKQRKEAVKIEINLSKLGDIRRSSDIIREKLIVEEDHEEEVIETITETNQTDVIDDTPLDRDEYIFMQALLYGRDYKKAASEHGKMVSILADSINEKLFDSFGDTVIEFSGDTPVIIEDYSDELKTMICKP